MGLLERIKAIADNEGITISALERRIGASKGVISRALLNRSDIQAKWVTIIADNYPKYSPLWLLTGEGKMYREDCGPATVNLFRGGKNLVANGNGNKNSANEGAAQYNVPPERAERVISELISQYRDFIAQQAAQIRTKDEQIANLLSIIASMQKG